MERYLRLSLRHNFIVNVWDGGFFGFAVGLASFVTVIPLFVSHLTDSALLIGLIPAIHGVGWMLPQLLTANRVARMRRYLPMVLAMTIFERLPFLGLAIVALALPVLPHEIALGLTYFLLVMEGLSAGLAATAWQSMVAKLIPPHQRGTFYGTQAAAASLLSSVGAVIAGVILEQFGLPINFAICFALAFGMMIISFGFLAWTREPAMPAANIPPVPANLRDSLIAILRRDGNFRWFLVAKILFQLATMASAFYTVYAVKHHNVSVLSAGLMTGVFMGTQIVANPIMGWIGDHVSHRAVLEVGALAAIASALLASWAPRAEWFYLAFTLAGIANVAVWTISIAMTIDFAHDVTDRPAYIGLANTLVAPSAILAPLLGGLLADTFGYPIAFFVAVVGGIATEIVLRVLLRDPRAVAGSVRL